MTTRTTTSDRLLRSGVALLFAAPMGFAAYLLWPEGILDAPLSSLTLGALLRAVAAALCVGPALSLIVFQWTDR